MRAAVTAFTAIALAVFLFGSSCANIVPPGGGPRDSIPPQLLSVTPADSTLNFRESRIIFTFDEYINLQDLSNNLLFSPSFDINPEISSRGKTLMVRFRDTLSPNTTYILNFGNAIRDVNEGNILRGLVYTFSTGAFLDTLELTGRVILAQTGKVDSTMVVVLHSNLNDSAVINATPRYITHIDGSGNFRFTNLPPGEFALYAMGEPQRYNRRYMSRTQLFAFLDSTVNTTDSGSFHTLYAYREAAPVPPATISPRGRGTERRIIYTTNLVNNQLDITGDLTLIFNTPLRTLDTGLIRLFTDSVYTPSVFTATMDSAGSRLQIQSDWKPGTSYQLVLDRDFATDTLGLKLLKTDTLMFTTRSMSEYAHLLLRMRNLDMERNPVIQFVQNEQVVYSGRLSGGIYENRMFTPGEYDLRILYDTDGDGSWTPGDFFSGRRQPELVEPLQRKITVRPNWENEIEIAL